MRNLAPVPRVAFAIAAASFVAALPGAGATREARAAERAATRPVAAAPTTAVAAPTVAAEAPAAPGMSPADEVRSMLAVMAQIETDARRMLASLGDPAAVVTDPQGEVRQRLEARIRSLLDPAEVATAGQAARQKFDAGDIDGARARIIETLRPFLARSEEVRTLVSYPARRLAVQRSEARLRALLRANGIDSPALARIEQLKGLLAAREARDDFAMAAGVELADLESLQQQAYDTAFQAAVAAARGKSADTLQYQPREVRCPLAADTGAPGDVPRLDATLSAPTSAYYPKDALEQGIEGKVALSARIDPQGCVRSAALLVGTGVEALDVAALRWMLEGAVYRRSQPRADGQPATSALSVSFKAVD